MRPPILAGPIHRNFRLLKIASSTLSGGVCAYAELKAKKRLPLRKVIHNNWIMYLFLNIITPHFVGNYYYYSIFYRKIMQMQLFKTHEYFMMRCCGSLYGFLQQN
jgi:hypothetical protein